MSFLDRLFGRDRRAAPAPRRSVNTTSPDPDAQTVDRYRYLLRTAPPDQIERAHAEAFAQLSPDQRAEVLRDLAGAVPASERPASADPDDLARAATRAELREPGTLERTFRGGAMPGMAGSFMSTFAAVVVGTTVAQALFGGLGPPFGGDPRASGGSGLLADTDGDEGDGADLGSDASDAGGFGDLGGFGGDFGGDF